MVIKISSKNQVTIPKDIAEAFTLKKGDFLEIQISGHKIVMTPQEVIFEDKYPREDLEAAEKILAKDSSDQLQFPSSSSLIKHLKGKMKK